jgi:hypothetical protein
MLEIRQKQGSRRPGPGCAPFASLGCGVGPVDAGPTWSRLELSPHLEAGTGGNRRRWPPVNGADDLAAVDALQVDARDGKVGVPKLPLDNNQRNALVRHLDGVRVPQLMRREPTPDASFSGRVMQLLPRG